ncbi:MAG: hypothetical protein HYY96_13070 [Candidatus Tectomicrobia bacterium]|nr:hypothetical protein [Candidatus Tectomicrobia bacterium]
MKRRMVLVLGALLGVLLAGVMSTPASAELKPVNRLMVAQLRDVTGIVQSIVTYDFDALVAISTDMEKRQRMVMQNPQLAAKTKEFYGQVADHAGHIAKFAKEKNKDEVVKHFALLFETCHKCHSEVRDKPQN